MAIVICPCCRAEFERPQKRVNAVVRRMGRWMCKPCANKENARLYSATIGSSTVRNSGYVFEKTEAGWIQQHRIVMERHIGRKLHAWEVVHHKNEVKTDNRIENLEICEWSEHTRNHHVGARRQGESLRRLRESQPRRAGTKLSSELVKEACARFQAGETQRSIAEFMNVSPMTISRAVRGESWKNHE